MLSIFNSKHRFKNVLQGLQKNLSSLSVPSCQNSFYTHHSTHRWPVVMAAGTSEPDLAETSSPPSGTQGGLSWGDIQPEPTVADNCGDCGKGLAILIYRPAAPLLLHVVRCSNSIVINHQENYEHANECPSLIRQPKEEINLWNECLSEDCSYSLVLVVRSVNMTEHFTVFYISVITHFRRIWWSPAVMRSLACKMKKIPPQCWTWRIWAPSWKEPRKPRSDSSGYLGL